MRRLATLLLCLASLTSAGEAKGGYPVIDWSKQPAGATGDTQGDLMHPTAKTLVMRYHIFAPAKLPERRTLGLMIAFHGMPGNEHFMTLQSNEGLVGAGLTQDYVLAGGKSLGVGWADTDEPLLMQFIDYLMTVYPIDRRRVFVWGGSNGGNMTAKMAARHADRIAGAAPLCGYGLPEPDGADPATTLLEYYIVHGDKDEACNVSGSRRFRTSIFGKGFRGVYRELDGGSHIDAVWQKPILTDTARWMHAVRHKQIAPSDAETKWLKAVANEQFAKPETWTELARIGGVQGWAVASRAQKSTDPAVRLALAKACGTVFFAGEVTVAALAKLAEDKDAAVRLAAIDALAMHAAWRTASAQTALLKLIQARKGPEETRVAAAKALAAALPMILRGDFSDDPVLLDAVESLLESDLKAVREAFSAPVLEKVAECKAYDPASDAAARKAPIAAWKAWLEAQRALDADKGGKPKDAKDKPKKK